MSYQEITTNTTYTVGPSGNYSNLESALKGSVGINCKNGARIFLKVLASHTLGDDDTSILDGGDYSNITIIHGSDSYPGENSISWELTNGNTDLLWARNCTAPRWGFLADMGGTGRNGILLENSKMDGVAWCGVINASENTGDLNPDFDGGYNNDSTEKGSRPNGCGVALFRGGYISAPIERAQVSSSTGSSTSTYTYQLNVADQKTENDYYAGYILNAGSEAIVLSYNASANEVTCASPHGGGSTYTLDRRAGFVVSGAARRGICATYNSSFSLPGLIARNCGRASGISGDIAARSSAWVSRTSGGQLDLGVFNGSVKAIRAARSDMVSARQIIAVNVNDMNGYGGTIASASEGSKISMTDSYFDGSGDTTGNNPMFSLKSNTGSANDGSITIAGSSMTLTYGPLLDGDGGTFDSTSVNGSSAAASTPNYLITAINSADVIVNSMAWNAGNKISNFAKIERGSKIVTNASLNTYNFLDSNSVTLENGGIETDDNSTSFGGDVYFSSGGSGLNHYEEGEWTPTVTDGTNTATLSISTGFFTRIGNMVTVVGRIKVSSVNGVGNVRIGGLKYTSGSATSNIGGGSVNYASSLALPATGNSITLQIANGRNFLQPLIWDSTGGTTLMTGSQISTNGELRFSATYFI